LGREETVYRFLLGVFAVAFVCVILGCETELQRQQREAVEAEEKMNDQFEAQLKAVEDFAAKANKQDDSAVLAVIEKYEEIQNDARAVAPSLQTRFLEGLHAWNDVYLALGKKAYEEVKAAAKKNWMNNDYEAALADYNKFPEPLGKKGPYGKIVENEKKALEAWRDAPEEAHSAMAKADGMMAEGDYDGALQACDAFYRDEKIKNSPMVRFVRNKHMAVIEELLGGLIREGLYDDALERIKQLRNRYQGSFFDELQEFLNDREDEVNKKKATDK
jgi:hypothetical protein